jgi:hypothetical protein
MTSKTFAVWIVMDENGDCEVATDEATGIDRWKNSEFSEGFAGAAVCRIVKLNVTMSEPLEPDNGKDGRYSLIDTTNADIGAAKGQGLRNCTGCEAAIARKLGPDQALIGVVTKISVIEYVVKIQVSDPRNGEIISSFTTDLRMGADYSWSGGVRWLMQNRVLAPKKKE